MVLFGSRKEPCPACGQKAVEREDPLWICTRCAANGPTLGVTAVDLGLRGDPRSGEYEQYRPRVPIAAQLTGLPELGHLPSELVDRLDLAYFDWYYALNGTSFDIEDRELEAAEATRARNRLGDPHARADDARFYTLTAISTAGWRWRRAEQVGDEPSAPAEAHEWMERYSDSPSITGRSDAVGLIAGALADSRSLENHSPGGEQFGLVFLNAGWLLTHGALVAPQPREIAALHPTETLHESFRFGVALRDAEIAYDAAATA